ncbi:hypothetical protein Tco_1447190 [Tanacetum coccineum]
MNQPQPVVSTQGTHRTAPRSHRTPTLTAASPKGKKRKQGAGETSSLRKSLKKLVEEEIDKMVEGEEDEESYTSEFADSMLNDDDDDDDDDSGTRIEPGSHKENPKVVADDDVTKRKDDEKDEDEVKDDDVEKTDNAAEEKDNDDHTNHTLVGTHATGSIETRNEQMQTPIPTPTRSTRNELSSDKTISEELTTLVSPTTATTSKTKTKRGFTSNKTKILLGIIASMCSRRGKFREFLDSFCNNVVPDDDVLQRQMRWIKENMPRWLLMRKKSHRRGKMYKWETATYDFSTEPTISPQHIDEFNLKDETSLSECDEKEQNVLYFNNLFPFNVIYPDDSKLDKGNDDDKIDIKQSSGTLELGLVYLFEITVMSTMDLDGRSVKKGSTIGLHPKSLYMLFIN